MRTKPLFGAITMAMLGVLACRPGDKLVRADADDTPQAPTPELGNQDDDVAVAPKTPVRRPESKPVTSVDQAVDAIHIGNPEGASKFLSEHLDLHPDDRLARLAWARSLVAVGDYEQADRVLSDPRGSPEQPDVLRHRARLALSRGDFDQAETWLERSLQKLGQDHADSMAVRGELLAVLVARGKAAQARARTLMESLYDDYDAGKAKQSGSLLAVARAALARGTRGGFLDANMVLQQAETLALEGTDSMVADEILLVRGALFLEKYRADEARQTFGLVLKHNPWHSDALVGLARSELDVLDLTSAHRAATMALQTNPRHPDAHAVLARIALVEGRREHAHEQAETLALAVNSNHIDALAVMAALAVVRKQPAGYAKWRDRALAIDGTGARFATELADMLAFLHLYEDVDKVLGEANRRAPEDPYLQSAMGLNLLRLGHETAGRAALEHAWKRDSFNERTKRTLDLFEQRIDKDYVDVSSAALSLRLPKQDQELVAPLLRAAIERARSKLDARYGVPAGALRFEVFADPHDFSVRTVGVPSLGAVGVCFGQLVTLIGPYRGHHNVDQVIWHELSHVYAIKLSQNRVPRWFTEGLSEWESELADPSWARESADLLQRARKSGKLHKLSQLELAFLRAENPMMMEVAYATAAYAMRYLGRTYGLPKLVEILKGYADGSTTELLFRRYIDKDMATVEREFETWLTAELDAKRTGWLPSERRKGKRPDDKVAPDPRDARLRTAIALIRKKHLDEASRELERLIRAGGDGYATRMMLGKILSDGPNAHAAKAHFQKARTFHAEAIEPLVALGQLARKRGDVMGEKHYLREAMAIDAMSFDPAARLLMLAVTTNDASAFALASARARAIAPLHPITIAGDALALHRKGDRNMASARFKRALDGLAQGPPDTLVVMAIVARETGDPALAKQLAEKALHSKALPKTARDAMLSIRAGQ